jgi:V/A-type H+-transporting ATPase subunit I
VIVPMMRVEIAGPRRRLPEVVSMLQREGVLQVRPLSVPLERWRRGVPLRGDAEERRRLEAAVPRLQALLRALPHAAGDEATVIDPAAEDLGPRLEAVSAELRAVDERRGLLEEEASLLERYQRLLVALAPLLHELQGAKNVEAIGVLFRRNAGEGRALLEAEIAKVTGGAYTLHLRDLDAEQVGGFLAVHHDHAAAVSQLLYERGVGEIQLPQRYQGRSFADSVAQLLSRHRELAGERAACEAERLRLGQRWSGPLAAAEREARDRLARLVAESYCGETRHAFVVAGWAPRPRVPRLREAVAEAFAADVQLFVSPVTREEADDVPVVISNPPWLRPFERLLALAALPRYGSIDPTLLVELFLPLYFGVIIGDLGHGALILAVALIARRRGWGGALGRDLSVVAATAAVSVMIFGVLFGELFGTLGEHVGLHPLLFDRREALVPLLGLAVALGAAQIALGLVLGMVSAWRRRDRRAAIARLTTLALIAITALLIFGTQGMLPAALIRPGLAALGGLLVLSIVLEGLLAPLELVRALGNILSYARLMAVGMASVMLGVVANRLGELDPAPLGIFLAVFLHGVNFTLGLLSPTIQALRLQYVEFFDKFFEPGGRPFEPLAPAR